MPVATIEGLKVNYLVQGSGPHLLMLAPGGFDSTIDRHIEFAREYGLAAAVERACATTNFWHDPEAGPWAAPIRSDGAFAQAYAKQDLTTYLEIVAASRDAMFGDTMPSGASGEALMAITTPALVLPGADASHATSAAWALAELMPAAEFWNVLPPHQRAAAVLERILEFKGAVENSANAPSAAVGTV